MFILKANALLLCFYFFNLRIYAGVFRRGVPSDVEKILKNTSENNPFPGLSAQCFGTFYNRSVGPFGVLRIGPELSKSVPGPVFTGFRER